MSSLGQLIRWASVFSATSMAILYDSKTSGVEVTFINKNGDVKKIDGNWASLVSELMNLHVGLNLNLVSERLKIREKEPFEWRARLSHYPVDYGKNIFQFDLLKIYNENSVNRQSISVYANSSC